MSRYKGTINAQSMWQDQLRDSEIPVTFNDEASDKICGEDIKVGDQVVIFAALHFARREDERFEVTETVKCDVLVEDVRVVARGVWRAADDDVFNF